jgi:hypothetical protein
VDKDQRRTTTLHICTVPATEHRKDTLRKHSTTSSLFEPLLARTTTRIPRYELVVPVLTGAANTEREKEQQSEPPRSQGALAHLKEMAARQVRNDRLGVRRALNCLQPKTAPPPELLLPFFFHLSR